MVNIWSRMTIKTLILPESRRDFQKMGKKIMKNGPEIKILRHVLYKKNQHALILSASRSAESRPSSNN